MNTVVQLLPSNPGMHFVSHGATERHGESRKGDLVQLSALSVLVVK